MFRYLPILFCFQNRSAYFYNRSKYCGCAVFDGNSCGIWFQTKAQESHEKRVGKLIAIGAIGGGIPFALFFTGLSEIGALNSNIIQKTLFLWVALLAVPLLKERISKIQLVGYVSLFIGMFVVGGTIRFVSNTGTWLILSATMLWAIENVIAKVTLKTVSPIIVSWGRMVFGLPFLFIAMAVMGKFPLLLSPAAYAPIPIIVSSALLTLYVTTWYSALALAPATLVSAILVFAPVVTALLGSVILKKNSCRTTTYELISSHYRYDAGFQETGR